MTFVVFVYSHYAPESIKFLKLINDNLDTLETFYNYKMECVCVDDERIKRIILASKKLSVRIVPSVIVVREDNKVSVHEATEAFNWLYEHPEIELPTSGDAVRQTISDVLVGVTPVPLQTPIPQNGFTPINPHGNNQAQVTQSNNFEGSYTPLTILPQTNPLPGEVTQLAVPKTALEIKGESLLNAANKMQQEREGTIIVP